jgi:hypothetical protein
MRAHHQQQAIYARDFGCLWIKPIDQVGII